MWIVRGKERNERVNNVKNYRGKVVKTMANIHREKVVKTMMKECLNYRVCHRNYAKISCGKVMEPSWEQRDMS